MHFDVLKKQVSEFKNSEEGRRVMCKAMERIAERNKAEGKAEGKRENMLATAKRMLKDGILALKDIAKVLWPFACAGQEASGRDGVRNVIS